MVRALFGWKKCSQCPDSYSLLSRTSTPSIPFPYVVLLCLSLSPVFATHTMPSSNTQLMDQATALWAKSFSNSLATTSPRPNKGILSQLREIEQLLIPPPLNLHSVSSFSHSVSQQHAVGDSPRCCTRPLAHAPWSRDLRALAAWWRDGETARGGGRCFPCSSASVASATASI